MAVFVTKWFLRTYNFASAYFCFLDENPLCLALTMFPAMDSHIKVFADEERDGDVISLM